jgi:enoyl-CoA hydratase/carnithine racemase
MAFLSCGAWDMQKFGDVAVDIHDHVALLEIQRPPNNFFDVDLINALGDAFDAMDEDPQVRALVLAAQGKHFCAGANFANREQQNERAQRNETDGNPLYNAAVRLFAGKKPVIGAIQGAAVGGGFGLAVMPDFRVVCPEARFTANFVKLGFHPGFGLTHTLPLLIGQQKANLLFLTGRRLLSVRATMRQGLAEAVKKQTDIEFAEQFRLQKTADHKEGVRAVAERRVGNFTGT